MQPEIVMYAVGQVRGGRVQPEDDSWDSEVAVIELDARFSPDALAGLEGFSHVEVVFHFRVPQTGIHAGAGHPRGRADWPLVGIFARATARRGPIA